MGIDNVNEVYVEKVHSRKSKTNFKGVVQKMLISSLVLTTVLGTSAGAFAAEAPKMDMSKVQTVAYENNISVDTALREIRTTVAKLRFRFLRAVCRQQVWRNWQVSSISWKRQLMASPPLRLSLLSTMLRTQ